MGRDYNSGVGREWAGRTIAVEQDYSGGTGLHLWGYSGRPGSDSEEDPIWKAVLITDHFLGILVTSTTLYHWYWMWCRVGIIIRAYQLDQWPHCYLCE